MPHDDIRRGKLPGHNPQDLYPIRSGDSNYPEGNDLPPFMNPPKSPGDGSSGDSNYPEGIDLPPPVNPPGAIRRILTPPGEEIPPWARLPGGPPRSPVPVQTMPDKRPDGGGGSESPENRRGGLTDTEFDAFQKAIEDSVLNGDGRFPEGALRYEEIDVVVGTGPNAKIVKQRVLTEESADLRDYYEQLRDWKQQQQEFQGTQRQSEMTFLQSLLSNPSALAAFQLMRGQGGMPFQGGVPGLPQGQLPSLPQGQLPAAAGRFGFNPYETIDTTGGVPGEPGMETGLERQTRARPVGSPISSFFQGGIPTLGGLGGPQNQDLQGLLGMLALFGINPQQFQQQSAMVTPRAAGQGGARLALPAGRR